MWHTGFMATHQKIDQCVVGRCKENTQKSESTDEDTDMDSALKEASHMYEFISNLVDDGPMPTSVYNLANIVTSCNGNIFTAWARVTAHYDSATLPEFTPESLWLDYQAFKALPVDQEDQSANPDEPALRVPSLLPHSLSHHLQDMTYVTHPHIAPVATPHETTTALPSDPPVSAAPVPVTAPSEACYPYIHLILDPDWNAHSPHPASPPWTQLWPAYPRHSMPVSPPPASPAWMARSPPSPLPLMPMLAITFSPHPSPPSMLLPPCPSLPRHWLYPLCLASPPHSRPLWTPSSPPRE